MSIPSSRPTGRGRNSGFRCAECGWSTTKWVGRCTQCQAWGAVEAVGTSSTSRTTVSAPSTPALPVGEIDTGVVTVNGSGLAEVDRVLGGGFVPGAVVLICGEPGMGKSTLLLEVAARTAATGRRVLYVSGEESPAQIRMRAERTDCVQPGLLLAAENDLSAVLGHIDQAQPDLMILDSVQTVASTAVEGAPGNVSQVREVAATLVQEAKRRHLTTVLVGHVTKDGSLAGPRLLEHVVDVVCSLDGDRYGRLRMLRAAKNRFGPTDEVGCFEMVSDGLREVADPSALFCSRQDLRAPGTCVTVTLEGRRPLLVEIQSLITASSGQARRVVSGVDSTRSAIIAAVLTNRLRLPLPGNDVFVSTVGGAVLREPAADLAMALSLGSAAVDCVLPTGLVALGEVGLTGEIRPVPGLARRLSEAARLGFTRALVPHGSIAPHEIPEGIRLVEIGQLIDVIRRGILKAPTPIDGQSKVVSL